jgi:hypothetical protein
MLVESICRRTFSWLCLCSSIDLSNRVHPGYGVRIRGESNWKTESPRYVTFPLENQVVGQSVQEHAIA